ncbi:MAG: riboflavin biosynthesis protein RibF, partial [Hyphomonadaceae bacterium]|nr:riboflavin biosynthesis protein RibF [Hyphomonadaceae bacterium]
MLAIHTSLAGLPPDARGCAVAIGAFDGLHLGHQALLRHAATAAACPVMILTFEPPPKLYFNPGGSPGRLTTSHTRALAAEPLGVSHILELPFNAAMAAMDATDFAALLCGPALGARHLVVGHDFAFGRGRAGDVALLRSVAGAAGIDVSVVAPVQDATGTRVSSTRIRVALEAGDVAQANALLGRPWLIEATVIDGEKRGRLLGWPTANL